MECRRYPLPHRPPQLAFRKVSLDSANAPTLASPVAPFAKSERQKAYTSATYYSECFLRGIQPIDADLAAYDAGIRYKKWWVKACYQEENQRQQGSEEKDERKRRIVFEDAVATTSFENNSRCKRRKNGSFVTVQSRSISPVNATILTATTTRDVSEVLLETLAATKTNRGNTASPDLSLHVLTDEEGSRGQSCSSSQGDDDNECRERDGCDDLEAEDSNVIAVQQPIQDISCLTKGVALLKEIDIVKIKLLEHLKMNGGDNGTDIFRGYLDTLNSFYRSRGWDARCTTRENNTMQSPPSSLDGKWLDLSKPMFSGGIEEGSKKGECIYTLGRMSFDMFRPANLRCCLTGMYNDIRLMDNNKSSKNNRPTVLPRKLAKQIAKEGSPELFRHYDLVVNFTIQENQTRDGTLVKSMQESINKISSGNDEYVVRRSIKGSITNLGYLIPDPEVPNRLTVWFCGGTLKVDDDKNLETWKELFLDEGTSKTSSSSSPPANKHASAEVLATKVLLGAYIPEKMKEDGTMKYLFKRPIGGNGQVFCDVLYMDETLRIMKGHSGSIFVHSRVSSVANE